jgi:hypothetical protein
VSASNAGRIGVWGASGSGKSAFTKRLIAGRKRVVILDPMAEYAKGQRVIACQSADAVRRAMIANWSGFRLALVPEPGNESAYLNQLCHLILAAQKPYLDGASKSGMTLVVEEMNTCFPLHGSDKKCPKFAAMCSRGRHSGVEVIGISQRMAEVATRFRGNCTETVLLRQQGPNDLRAASDTTGIGADRIRALKNLEYLHYKAGNVTGGKLTF